MCLSKQTREAIDKWMRANGVKRIQLAKALNRSPQQITNILNGHDEISSEMADKIVAVLGCRIRVILEKR